MPKTLRFRDDRTFTIVQFTDTHWHNGEPLDRQTQELMEMVVDQVKPDLVALTGDILSGGNCVDPRESLRQVVGIIEEREIHWAFAIGNHDCEGSVSREELMEFMSSFSMNLSEPGPSDISGVGNYVLRVQSSDDENTAALLYFLDSGREQQGEVPGSVAG